MPSTPEPAPCIAQGFCFALYSSAHAMMKAYAPLLKDLGLTYPQFLVLFALWEKNDRTVSDLGNTLFLDSGTLTPLLKRMEKAGLLRRKRSAEDERQVRVTLTPRGNELRSAGMEAALKFQSATGRSGAELAPIQATLSAVRDRLLSSVKDRE